MTHWVDLRDIFLFSSVCVVGVGCWYTLQCDVTMDCCSKDIIGMVVSPQQQPEYQPPPSPPPPSEDASPAVTNKMQMQVFGGGGGDAHQVYPEPLATHREVVADRDLFLATLIKFHAALGTRLSIPKIGGRDLDLHYLYKEVSGRGGLQMVQNIDIESSRIKKSKDYSDITAKWQNK